MSRKVARDSRARDTFIPKHICCVCQRPRSSSYHARHPLGIGDSPIDRVCTRCIRKGRTLEHTAPLTVVVIQEVHHYYHTCACMDRVCSKKDSNVIELPADSPRVELPGEDSRRFSTSFLDRLVDRPPVVRTWKKPYALNGLDDL
jgi:hypothetical protein